MPKNLDLLFHPTVLQLLLRQLLNTVQQLGILVACLRYAQS